MPTTKNPYKRFRIIDGLLRHKTFPSRERIIKVLEENGYPISIKTFEKDIEVMRSELDLDVKYDSKRKGYYYGNNDVRFDIVFTEEELALIYMAVAHIKHFEFAHVTLQIKETIEKIAKRMHISMDKLRSISDRVHFSPSYPHTGMRKNIKDFFDGMFYKQKVQLNYKGKLYTIIPLCLVQNEDDYNWQLVGQTEDGTLLRFKIFDMDYSSMSYQFYTESDIKVKYINVNNINDEIAEG